MRPAPEVSTDGVRRFWEANPLSASAVPHPFGTREYFACYDRLRERNESVGFSRALHEYDRFAGLRVLDVGCGNGYVLSRYARAGARVTGIDLTARGVGVCRLRFAQMGLRGTFLQADAQRLPFADGAFDAVCSMGVLHHVPDTAGAVAEIRRVLQPGGKFISMVYHRDSLLYRVTFPWVGVLTGKDRQTLVNEVDGAGNPKGDVYSREEYARLLSGFEGVETSVGLLQAWMVLPYVGRIIPDALLKPWAGRWGWFLYAKARNNGYGRLVRASPDDEGV